ncbi:M24 family metallopeptidase [Qingshengfaniella alkalisoli]|uniref:Aminopeptidase P family protein n=1 Tax=Qingshengfaniella alkalisoli TaxID=2599296 RepID=A0A5B8IXK5_9RHOB|nr:Xaa-Pro peptidase family protein [Qingshengfaniella alkalisoli]QDY70454.1 aminopeptidase P family protein [Qingshengfaniella alkalisoli]
MNRLDMLRERMAAESVDLVAIGPGAHMDWLLGFHPHPDERPCLACVSATGAAFLMPALNAEGTRAQTDLPFFNWTDAEGPVSAFNDLLVSLNAADAQRIALDETMRADFAALVQDALPHAAREFSATTIGALRMRKDAAEFDVLKRNALIADKAMRAGWAAMKPGMTELEVAQIIRAEFTAQGAKPLFSIVGTGGNGAFPHHQTGDTVLKDGDSVVMDIGGGMDSYSYSSDMTRMAVLGTPPVGYEEVHAIVEAAVQAAMKAARPGVKAHEVDDAARGVITEAGYGEYFVHRTGHGMGVEVHEQPYLTSVSQTILEEGMVFSIEPGIYIPGRFGIRLEDIVILRSDGPEILSELPRDLKVI